jgi:glycosyltransferase involved in cell wall biosynthesis
MNIALATAEGLVTVSSTAAIEAMARGLPVIALDTFGVSRALINETLADAGLLGSEGDVVARRLRHPAPHWLDDNYFHPSAADDWEQSTAALIAQRRAGALAPRPALARRGGVLRDAWERRVALGRSDTSASGAIAYAVGLPVRAVVRGVHRARRTLVPRVRPEHAQ